MIKNISKQTNNNSTAFTIVELLVVIVVIGILAAITIVSYSGIARNAALAVINSDLSQNAKLLNLYNVEYGYFPTTLDSNNCPSTPTPDSRYCLKLSKNNNLLYSGGGQTFQIAVTNPSVNITQKVSNNSSIATYTPSNTYVKTWGGSGDDVANEIVQTSDNGYVTTGHTTSYGSGSYDAFLSKYTADGSLSWSKTWGGTGDDVANSVVIASDGGYVISGRTTSYGAGGNDAFIAKFTSDGKLSWSKTWGGTGDDVAIKLVRSSDDGYVISGRTTSYGAGGNDAILVKFNTDGTLSWSKTWGGTGSDIAPGLIRTADNGYAIVGYTTSYGAGDNDAFFAKFTIDGTLSWSRVWGGAGTDIAVKIIQVSDSGYIISGQTKSYGAGIVDAFLVKYTVDGALSWSKTWGGSETDVAVRISPTSDNGYVIVGYTSSYGSGGYDAFLAKFNSNDGLSWSRVLGGVNNEIANDIIQIDGGGYLLAGYTASYGSGANDALILRYDKDGNINNCGSMCQTPTATITAPSATISSPTASESSPSVTVTSPSAATTIPDVASSFIVLP